MVPPNLEYAEFLQITPGCCDSWEGFHPKHAFRFGSAFWEALLLLSFVDVPNMSPAPRAKMAELLRQTELPGVEWAEVRDARGRLLESPGRGNPAVPTPVAAKGQSAAARSPEESLFLFLACSLIASAMFYT